MSSENYPNLPHRGVTIVRAENRLGDFTFFGITQEPEANIRDRMAQRLGISPRIIRYGPESFLFFYSSYGDIAETEEAIALKLGFVRSPEQSYFSSKQLLTTKTIEPLSINTARIRGNALLACFSKSDPDFSAFKTLLGVSQLYFSIREHGIICSDRLGCIVNYLDHVDLDEELVPMHFLFRSTPGDLTYHRQIKRMLPGQTLKWANEKLFLCLDQDLRFSNDEYSDIESKPGTVEGLYESLDLVVKNYINQVTADDQSFTTLLSGGVDSSILQLLINPHISEKPGRTFSFAVRVPSFQHEIEYARQASQLFHTEHTFVEFEPDEFPNLLIRAIETLGQPPILETQPALLAVAEYSPSSRGHAHYFFSGQGADTIFGLTFSRKLKGLQQFGNFPGAAGILKALGKVTTPAPSVSQMLTKGASILASSDDPDSVYAPANSIAVYGDLDLIRRCFGDEVVKRIFRYRRDLALEYLETKHYLERVHVVDLMTDTYEIGVQSQQLFLANKKELIFPFFDDDILRSSFAFHPEKRYIKGFRTKYLLKEILEQKTGAAVARKPKGFSIFEQDLYQWMASGALRPMVREIELPGFLSRKDFENLLKTPSYFLWELLVFDLFKRYLHSTLQR